MALSPGTRLGPYEILSPLGAGGMGEVYRARDTRLDRDLAIKVLPAEVSFDRERLKRFALEARAASALNHPNILTVYDIGFADSISYIAMEFVDGTTLGNMLVPGPLPIKKLLDIAVQVAEGLASAHETGIVHRDLKPRNVMVSKEGFVKILDFGLAKLSAPTVGPVQSRDSTVAAPETRPGQVLGTVEYMSPEQARGEQIDFRSDQFSFGAVLYEMATGRRAFRENTPIDTLYAVLNSDPPPIVQVQPGVPAILRWTIERCLAKPPAERYQSTRDLARELRGFQEHLSEISGALRAARTVPAGRRLGAIAAVAGALVLGAALWSLVGGPRRSVEPEFRRLTFRRGAVSRGLFAPRSNSILYTASWEGQSSRTYLTLPESAGIDKALNADPQLPMAYTEDGSQVLVLLGTSRPAITLEGTLAWWPALGGKARPILDGVGWADWGKRSRFLAVVRGNGAERVLEMRDAEGGFLRTLFRTSGAISFVRISPDEGSVAFIHHPTPYSDSGEVRIVATDGSRSRRLTPPYERCFGLDWNRMSGEIWFSASDSNAMTRIGAVDASGKLRWVYGLPRSFALQSVSPTGDGVLLTSRDDRTSLIVREPGRPVRDLSWYGWTLVSDLSPDGQTILFFDAGPTEMASGTWMRRLEGGDAVRLTEATFARFSPDARLIVALTASGASSTPQVAIIPVGAGKPLPVTSEEATFSNPSFAGSRMLLFARTKAGKKEIWRVDVDGKGARSLGVAGCDLPSASPTGGSFLCIGGERNGRLYVYPMNGGPGRTIHEVGSEDTFRYARWSTKGDQIFAVTGNIRFLAIDPLSGKVLRNEALPVPGEPAETLFTAAVNGDATIQTYSVATFSSELYLASHLRK